MIDQKAKAWYDSQDRVIEKILNMFVDEGFTFDDADDCLKRVQEIVNRRRSQLLIPRQQYVYRLQ